MILEHLKEFHSAASQIADINPYAKTAMNILTYTSKIILDHPDKDDALSRLFAKVSEVYAVLTEMQEVAKIASMLEIYGKLARQMLECADFIVHYTKTKRRRLDKDIYKEADVTIQSYIEVFDHLMPQLREQRVRKMIILHHAVEDLDFNDMVYAASAGLDISKCCLSGTREDILSKIKSWVYSTGEDVPRVLWLTGAADTGKSAIAHTIAKWFNELGGLGACFCFDRTRRADRREEKIFSTIACDLAAHDPFVRRALQRAFHNDDALKHTTNIARQWQELIVGPVGVVPKAIASPFLIIIDGLNESGEANSRKQVLHLLSNKLDATNSNSQLSELPKNYRILVTSRPLEDIHDALHAVAHVQHVSMDDIPPLSTEHDIRLYISANLAGPFDDRHFKALAQKADGVFEWARLACEYIKDSVRVGQDLMVRFERVLAETPNNQTRPLDVMYRHFLAEIMPDDERGEVIPMFRSVMGQILALQEPLSASALTAMRLHFSCDDDRYDVVRVIGQLDSLVIGATDCHIPIRLHPSFHDFITDRSRSHEFFADASLIQTDLAFASLGVMEYGLRFNICALESSHLPNSAVSDLQKRVEQSIPAELSYSCRFWGTHVQATSFEPALAEEIKAFFSGERLLFWLEALALMKGLDGPAASLSSISNWLKGDVKKYMATINAAKDVQEFVRTFGVSILHSTPHLYLSALPFSPSESIFRKFTAKFPRTPRVVVGHVSKRPLVENVLQGHDRIMSVAISPNSTLIVCGTSDGIIQVWEKDKTLDALPREHVGTVWSVIISPDGTRIVSGSNDKTIRVWDVGTRKSVGPPFQGHNDAVRSVAISSDGTRIVSGSNDKTIQMWDVKTPGALRDPLRGHTDFVLSVALSPDGNRIISGSADHTIRLWDPKANDALCILRGHTDWVQSVALSPDGNLVVSGSGDMTIRVWHAVTGKPLGTPLQGHTDDVLSVAISPDRKHIISGSADNTIRVWDAKTCKVVGDPLRGHSDYVRSVAISSDGQRIVSGSDDTKIWEWNLEQFKRQAPATYSRFNLIHTFHSASSLLQVSRIPASLTKDGWLVGPEGRLLLLIPHKFYPYIDHDTLVISNDSFQLDLSRVTHGTSWRSCREQDAAS